jgi:hypothetical protein
MDDEDLSLGTKDAQMSLLQQVLTASDADAEEEENREEVNDGIGGARNEPKVKNYYCN